MGAKIYAKIRKVLGFKDCKENRRGALECGSLDVCFNAKGAKIYAKIRKILGFKDRK